MQKYHFVVFLKNGLLSENENNFPKKFLCFKKMNKEIIKLERCLGESIVDKMYLSWLGLLHFY